MDITPTATIPPNTHTDTPSTKSFDPEPETPTRIQPRPLPSKPISLSNGVLKRHQPNHHHHPFHHHSHIPIVITYKECLKNHAASLGVLAVDGCGEFMPSPSATHTDPTSLKCAACGCHRNFHRREPDDPYSPNSPPPPSTPTLPPTTTIEYQPHHRHHPPPPPLPAANRSPNSSSPPPISSSYYPSGPHMLLALSTGNEIVNPTSTSNPSPRKRFRSKFSQSQKEKMFQFAERLGWKMHKGDNDLIQEFCNEIKVDRGVLKVWMHNNKNTIGKRVLSDTVINGMPAAIPSTTTATPTTTNANFTTSRSDNNNDDNDNNSENHDNNEDDNGIHQLQHPHFGNVVGSTLAVETNGGSSSSS